MSACSLGSRRTVRAFSVHPLLTSSVFRREVPVSKEKLSPEEYADAIRVMQGSNMGKPVQALD